MMDELFVLNRDKEKLRCELVTLQEKLSNIKVQLDCYEDEKKNGCCDYVKRDPVWFSRAIVAKRRTSSSIAKVQGQIGVLNDRIKVLNVKCNENRLIVKESKEDRRNNQHFRHMENFYNNAKAMLSEEAFVKINKAALGVGDVVG